MASQEKTEDPTPRRYEEARSRGQTAFSPELGSAVLLLAAFWVLQSTTGDAFYRLGEVMRTSFRSLSTDDLTPLMVYTASIQTELLILQILAPLFAVLTAGGIVLNVAQTRFLLTLYPLRPDLNRINPLAGFQRLCSTRSLVELAKTLGKAAVIGLVAYRSVIDQFPQMVLLSRTDLRQAVAALGGAAVSLGTRVSLVLLLLGVLDYLYRRREYLQGIRMTREELREEMRHTEGSPEVRARVRRLQRALAQGRSLPKVRQADVVVVNPTHYAVALRYRPAEMRAPRVVSKGRGLIAQQIRRIATLAGVPIVENPPLAQTLYRTVELGQEVPVDLYQAVAELLAFVYSLRGGKRGRES